MLKPDQPSEEEPEETDGVPEAQSRSFEERMILVFSGPMCFECLEEVESKEAEDDLTCR